MSSIPAKDWKSVWELLTSGIRDYMEVFSALSSSATFVDRKSVV